MRFIPFQNLYQHLRPTDNQLFLAMSSISETLRALCDKVDELILYVPPPPLHFFDEDVVSPPGLTFNLTKKGWWFIIVKVTAGTIKIIVNEIEQQDNIIGATGTDYALYQSLSGNEKVKIQSSLMSDMSAVAFWVSP